jgi:hypothetical protein
MEFLNASLRLSSTECLILSLSGAHIIGIPAEAWTSPDICAKLIKSSFISAVLCESYPVNKNRRAKKEKQLERNQS